MHMKRPQWPSFLDFRKWFLKSYAYAKIEKWGVKTQKWRGKNQISSKIWLLLTNFALFSVKVGGGTDPPAPLLPCYTILTFDFEEKHKNRLAKIQL